MVGEHYISNLVEKLCSCFVKKKGLRSKDGAGRDAPVCTVNHTILDRKGKLREIKNELVAGAHKFLLFGVLAR